MTATMTRAPMAELVYERLLLEGGWLCASELANIMGEPEATVRRTLYRLRSTGRAATRRVELAYSAALAQPRLECRTEWRAVSNGRG